eukprot:TRINITY_DN14204_c0_g1_i1.p1 TRINITY_DN14204_c0_g1~~TRINITY_DN14204_c0_g1_i1.p1  ORF type:complete len:263 (-),score=35.53 TRINITY_DN14204_c0_g1_i1:342-1106(-)
MAQHGFNERIVRRRPHSGLFGTDSNLLTAFFLSTLVLSWAAQSCEELHGWLGMQTKERDASLCASGLHTFRVHTSKLHAAALNSTSFAVHAAKSGLQTSQDALLNMPRASLLLYAELREACLMAGGPDVVLGAAAAGGTCGLCLGALLWSGDRPPMAEQRLAKALELARSKNRTAPLARLRRHLRRRLAIVSVASAGTAAYLCTLPTALEGGTGVFAEASALARRLGRAAVAAGQVLCAELPRPHSQLRRGYRI